MPALWLELAGKTKEANQKIQLAKYNIQYSTINNKQCDIRALSNEASRVMLNKCAILPWFLIL